MVENLSFLESWNKWGKVAALVLLSLGVLVLMYHFLRLITIRDYKKKYDYINRSEINLLWATSVIVIIAAGVFVNTLFWQTTPVWFFARIFITVALGLIIGISILNVLKFYYPFYIEKRLKVLRYSPRLSPTTGKAMKLLSEDEEDVYLDEGMQAEENVFSVDYDVWVDEESGYTKIEKYAGHLHAIQCSECNYQTLKVLREEILESPTSYSQGELTKFYKCSYCGHRAKKNFRIARLREATSQDHSGNTVPV